VIAAAAPGPAPKEALSYFRNKGLKVSFDYRDVWREEHAHAFTVAKAMQLDVLESIRGAVDQALAEGQTLRDFRKGLTPTLQRLGWWGRQEMVDPATGEIVDARLGSPRRLKTIYTANLRTARAAGQWERAQRTKAARPYLLRTLGPSRRHRPEHAAWHGVLLPIDDPWWKVHMPPDGWGCKCRVRQVSEAEAGRLKSRGVPAPERKQEVDAATGRPTGHLEKRYVPVQTTAPKIEYREWRNKRTGRIERVPAGCDPGWDTNPGQTRWQSLEKVLAERLEAAPPAVGAAAVKDLVESEAFGVWYANPTGKFPVGSIPETDATMIGARVRTLHLSAETAEKQKKNHPEIEAGEYAQVQDAVSTGLRVQDGPSTLFYILEKPQGYVVVVKSTRTGESLFLTSFRRLSADEAKRDAEIRRLLRRAEK